MNVVHQTFGPPRNGRHHKFPAIFNGHFQFHFAISKHFSKLNIYIFPLKQQMAKKQQKLPSDIENTMEKTMEKKQNNYHAY